MSNLLWDNGSTVSGLPQIQTADASTTMSNINKFDRLSITRHHHANGAGSIALVNTGWAFAGDEYNKLPSPSITFGVQDYRLVLALDYYHGESVWTNEYEICYPEDYDYTANIDFVHDSISLIKDNVELAKLKLSQGININAPVHMVYFRYSPYYSVASEKEINTVDMTVNYGCYKLNTDKYFNYYGILK